MYGSCTYLELPRRYALRRRQICGNLPKSQQLRLYFSFMNLIPPTAHTRSWSTEKQQWSRLVPCRPAFTFCSHKYPGRRKAVLGNVWFLPVELEETTSHAVTFQLIMQFFQGRSDSQTGALSCAPFVSLLLSYSRTVQLEEDDSPWDFDSLLQSITQEFNAEGRSEAIGLGGASGSTALNQDGSSSQLRGGSRRPSRALVA